MGIGGGIGLIVVGAIMSFGISDRIDGVNLTVIGYICMGAGALALILALVMNAQRSNTTHRAVVEERTTPQAPPAQQAPQAYVAQPAPARRLLLSRCRRRPRRSDRDVTKADERRRHEQDVGGVRRRSGDRVASGPRGLHDRVCEVLRA